MNVFAAMMAMPDEGRGNADETLKRLFPVKVPTAAAGPLERKTGLEPAVRALARSAYATAGST